MILERMSLNLSMASRLNKLEKVDLLRAKEKER
jgi:hypothetical protein